MSSSLAKAHRFGAQLMKDQLLENHSSKCQPPAGWEELKTPTINRSLNSWWTNSRQTLGIPIGVLIAG